jgi:hypothetical protein
MTKEFFSQRIHDHIRRYKKIENDNGLKYLVADSILINACILKRVYNDSFPWSSLCCGIHYKLIEKLNKIVSGEDEYTYRPEDTRPS